MKKQTRSKTVDHKEHLNEWLQDPEIQIAYLNEALKENDINLFLIALKDVIEARSGSLTAVSKKTKLSRPNLHRTLTKDRNPRIKTVARLLESVGLEWQVGSQNNQSKYKN